MTIQGMLHVHSITFYFDEPTGVWVMLAVSATEAVQSTHGTYPVLCAAVSAYMQTQ